MTEYTCTPTPGCCFGGKLIGGAPSFINHHLLPRMGKKKGYKNQQVIVSTNRYNSSTVLLLFLDSACQEFASRRSYYFSLGFL